MKEITELINKKIAIIAFVIWTILNISGISNIYFETSIKGINFVMAKILHLIFLYFIFYKIYSLYKERKNQKGKYAILYTLIYLLITILLVVITWPGTWSWDDIVIAVNTSKYDFTAWQHFFSGLFHNICMQTIPMVTGVVIIQILISSLIVGYCVSSISILFGKDKKQIKIIQIAILIIALFPPVTLYILSGFRMGIYSYIELLLICKLLIIYKERKVELKDILLISFLTIIVSCWRTEAFYYPYIVLILFLILGKKCIRKRVAMILFLIILISNYAIGKYNNYLIGNNNYSVTATIEIVTSIVKIATERNTKEIEAIDKVIDTKYILENPNETGEHYYWTTGVVKKYSKEEYSNYLKAYVKLVVKYPRVAFNAMWNIFTKAGSGSGENSKQSTKNLVPSTLNMYTEGSKISKAWSNVHSMFINPINLKLRNNIISFLGGIDSKGNLTIVYNVFWNLFIPFILIFICLIYKLVKKDWYMIFLILLIIARILLVFITSPAPYFMYYLSAYMCSYVLTFIIIFEFINNSKIIIKNKRK